MTPDLSVVIVSWNARKFFLDCLRSIKEQRCRHALEIIVVDNASSDGSAEAALEAFPEIRMIRNPDNLGFAKANNIGIREATGRHICLMNSDILLLPECLDRLIEFMDRTPRAAVAGPRVLNPDGTIQPTCKHFPSLFRSFCRMLAIDSLLARAGFFVIAGWHDQTEMVEMLGACLILVRREAMEEVGLLDEAFFFYGEDVDWCKRFHDAGWDLVYFPEARAIHFGGASSANQPIRFFLEMQKADLQYWRKHHSAPAVLAYRLMLALHQILRLPPRALEYLMLPGRRAEAAYKLKRSLACLQWLVGAR
jgi:GT2 family glycosyltransferase